MRRSLAALALLSAAPRAASAAPCCGDASALGRRLGRFELAAASFGLEAQARYGGWNGAGVASALAAGSHEEAFALEASWAVRAARVVELGVTAPVRARVKQLGDLGGAAAGVGDVTPYVRLELASPIAPGPAPGVFLTGAAVLPLGAPASSADRLGVGALGQGAGEARLSLSLEKAWGGRVFARVAGTVGLFAPTSVDGARIERSPRLVASGFVGPVLGAASLGLGLEREQEEAPRGGSGRGRARTSLVAAGSGELSDRWSLFGSLRGDLAVDGLGSNEIAGLTLLLGVRYALPGDIR